MQVAEEMHSLTKYLEPNPNLRSFRGSYSGQTVRLQLVLRCILSIDKRSAQVIISRSSAAI